MSALFSFHDLASSQIYTLSLHDALPISDRWILGHFEGPTSVGIYSVGYSVAIMGMMATLRSEEHTSELQSRVDLVCRLLLEKKKLLTCRHVPYVPRTFDRDGSGWSAIAQ